MKRIQSIDDLQPDSKNANLGTERGRGMLEQSLREFGAGRSILVDKEGVVIAGNKTLEVAEELGLPVRVVTTNGGELVVVQRQDLDLDDGDKARRLAYMDNRSSQVGLDWDAAQIVADLETDVDLSGLWSDEEIAELVAGVMEEPPEDPGPQIDRAEELRELWQTARGQIWEIPSKTVKGKCHRVMCGDSTSEEDIEYLVRERITGIVTDPPFNVGFAYVGEYRGQDKKTPDEYKAFLSSVLALGEAMLVSGAFVFVWQAATNIRHFASWFADHEWRILAAAKGMVQFLPTPVQYSWDPVVFWNADGDCLIKPVAGKRDWFLSNTASWLQDRVEGHPCPRPLDAVAYVVGEFTTNGEPILDPFLGSGTTMVAAEQTGRICYGMEIHPPYVAVTLQRLADMGLEPRLVE